jgi:phosphatidylglycerophosphatase A
MSWLRHLAATWFGSGLSPIVPGTAGTLATIPLVLLLWWSRSLTLHVTVFAAILVIGLWAAGDAEHRYGRKDPGAIVIDETAGYLVATLGFPLTLPHLGATFVLFRVFDIVKPWPARRLERLPGAYGIMIDDLFAGLYANLLLRLGLWVLERTAG